MDDNENTLREVDRPEEEPILPGNTNEAKERMTLIELRDYDDENHALIIKECELHRFEKPEAAGVFHWEAWRRCMKKLGCQAIERFWKDFDFNNNNRSTWALAKAMNILNREMVQKRIQVEAPSPEKIERLKKQQGPFRIGKYVYYQGNIVYFISDVLAMKRKRGLLYLPGEIDFCVFTNAPKE